MEDSAIDATLDALGVDSLLGISLRNELSALCGRELDVGQLSPSTTIRQLAESIE